ncbi:MAG TPA: tetratricopeptide repeat protein [Verrucomicrobiae bacterium]|nr:tetratricopeptide repeat protein [Verrucomicrobiae bacterium]
MTSTSQQRNRLIGLCLAAAIAVVYWPVLHAGFVRYDDDRYVTESVRVQGGLTPQNLMWAFTSRQAANWHPLTWVSLMLDREMFGTWAGGFHLVNVLLHAANTLLLFAVWLRMTGAPWRSACVAALFALHPLHVESVAWVAERKDVLSTCFGMLTVYAYIRYVDRPTPARYGLTMGLYGLGLLAKPMVVTLPCVLLLLDYWPLGRTRWAKGAVDKRPTVPVNRLVTEKLPFFALAAVSCAITVWAQRGGGAVVSLTKLPFETRAANALLAYVRYVAKTFWPLDQAVFYPFRPERSAAAVIGAGLALAAATTVVIWRSRREPWLVTGWFWYLGMLVPVIGLVQVGGQSMADRYTYLPMVGLLVMMCWSLPYGRIERGSLRATMWFGVVAVLAACAVLSRVQVGYWRSTETLFGHTLQVTRDNWLAHNNLGGALGQAGRVEEAIAHLQQALQIKPDYPEAHYNLGLALERADRTREAIGQYEQALQARPDYPEAHYNLGLALWRMGRLDEAIAHYEQAVRLDPDYVDAHNNLAVALWQSGKIGEAIRHYERAIQIKPDDTDAYNNLAWLLATVPSAEGGNPARAVTLAKRACELTGETEPAYFDTLAAAYAAAGRFDEAVRVAQKGVELARSGGQPQLAAKIAGRLQLYRAGRAYDESINAANPPKP